MIALNDYLIVLSATILLELAVVVCLWKWRGMRVDLVPLLVLVAGLNLVTHPLAWMGCWIGGFNVWGLEAGVVVAEATGLSQAGRISPGQAWLISLLMNGLSMAVGFAVMIAA